MKVLKLAAVILVFGTLTFAPKAEAKNLLNNRQVVAQVNDSKTENPNNVEKSHETRF